MPQFFHYTDGEGAQHIIRNGKINASLNYMTGGDTAFGNGVYLTELGPRSCTPDEIAINNWMDASPEFIRKTENYFVLDIPCSEVEDTNADGRNIFLYGWKNDLRLSKYRWWLMVFNSEKVITSYSFSFTSFGPASQIVPHLMRDYKMIDETVNGRPVYKSTGTRDSYYLFMDSHGKWIVRAGDLKDEDDVCLVQRRNYSLGPDPDLRWVFYDEDEAEWRGDDATLKCHGWQV